VLTDSDNTICSELIMKEYHVPLHLRASNDPGRAQEEISHQLPDGKVTEGDVFGVF
jgi:hypothetical protein